MASGIELGQGRPAHDCARSNSLNLVFIACSFGFPALCSQTSTLAQLTSCVVAGAFTVTVSRVAGPGIFSVNPHFRNSAMASVTASYNVLAATSTACPMLFVSVNETRQVRAVGTGR